MIFVANCSALQSGIGLKTGEVKFSRLVSQDTDAVLVLRLAFVTERQNTSCRRTLGRYFCTKITQSTATTSRKAL